MLKQVKNHKTWVEFDKTHWPPYEDSCHILRRFTTHSTPWTPQFLTLWSLCSSSAYVSSTCILFLLCFVVERVNFGRLWWNRLPVFFNRKWHDFIIIFLTSNLMGERRGTHGNRPLLLTWALQELRKRSALTFYHWSRITGHLWFAFIVWSSLGFPLPCLEI